MSSVAACERSKRFRSILSVPANKPEFFSKAAECAADALLLDLEDAVFPEHKLAARLTVCETLKGTIDWRDKRMVVRVNALGTEWGFRDLMVLGAECGRLDGFMIPKVETVEELRFVERLLDILDVERGTSTRLELHILVETAAGIARIEPILQAARRLRSVTFGAGDYVTSLGVYGNVRAAGNSDYVVLSGNRGDDSRGIHWGDSHHFAMARLSNACHAFDIMPVDGPYGDFSDLAGAEVATRRSRALGYQGKWTIHPSLVDMINGVFQPSQAEVDWAKRAAKALEQVRLTGAGAAQLDGRLIEPATLKTIKRILNAAGDADQD